MMHQNLRASKTLSLGVDHLWKVIEIFILPNFVHDITDERLMEEITKDELQIVLHSFQKDKSL